MNVGTFQMAVAVCVCLCACVWGSEGEIERGEREMEKENGCIFVCLSMWPWNEQATSPGCSPYIDSSRPYGQEDSSVDSVWMDKWMKKRNLTEDNGPGDVALVIVRQQHQLGDENAVVEPDRQHHADAQPAHGVNHEVQAKLHGGTWDDISQDLLPMVSSRTRHWTPTRAYLYCYAVVCYAANLRYNIASQRKNFNAETEVCKSAPEHTALT